MASYPFYTLSKESASSYDEYWEGKRGADLDRISSWQKERADIILKTLGAEGNEVTVGDIGSGPGAILNYLKQRLPALKGTGYEISPLALENLRKLGFEAVALDVNKKEQLTKIKEADYQLLLEIIEHVPHSEALVRCAVGAAHKGVFISVPNTGFLVYRIRLMFFGKTPMQFAVTPDEHLRFWSKADLEWWLRALSYKNFHVRGYRGVPILNKVWPNLFAAGLIAYISRT